MWVFNGGKELNKFEGINFKKKVFKTNNKRPGGRTVEVGLLFC
jgi:hypothetical protein